MASVFGVTFANRGMGRRDCFQTGHGATGIFTQDIAGVVITAIIGYLALTDSLHWFVGKASKGGIQTARLIIPGAGNLFQSVSKPASHYA